MNYVIILILLLCQSCTISITQTQSEGHASDLVDTSQTNDPEVSPTLSLPVSAL